MPFVPHWVPGEPPVTRPALGRGFTLSLLVATLLSYGACGLNYGDFDCENAASHLAQCCAGFEAASISCTHKGGCNGWVPEFDTQEADCVRAQSCGALVADGVCAMIIEPMHPAAAVDVCGIGSLYQQNTAPGSSFSYANIDCVGTEGCEGGLVCCATGDFEASACAPAPCSSGLQLCDFQGECPDDALCAPPGTIPLAVCQGGAGGSSSGPLGSEDASSLEDATDGGG
jgi:hypothetical protein